MSVFIGEIITTTKLLLISTPVSTQTDNITKISVCFYDLLHAYKNFYKESFFFQVQYNPIKLICVYLLHLRLRFTLKPLKLWKQIKCFVSNNRLLPYPSVWLSRVVCYCILTLTGANVRTLARKPVTNCRSLDAKTWAKENIKRCRWEERPEKQSTLLQTSQTCSTGMSWAGFCGSFKNLHLLPKTRKLTCKSFALSWWQMQGVQMRVVECAHCAVLMYVAGHPRKPFVLYILWYCEQSHTLKNKNTSIH